MEAQGVARTSVKGANARSAGGRASAPTGAGGDNARSAGGRASACTSAGENMQGLRGVEHLPAPADHEQMQGLRGFEHPAGRRRAHRTRWCTMAAAAETSRGNDHDHDGFTGNVCTFPPTTAGGAAAGALGRIRGGHDRLFLLTVGVVQTRTISANAPQAAEDGRPLGGTDAAGEGNIG
jgi:hypothetical protein